MRAIVFLAIITILALLALTNDGVWRVLNPVPPPSGHPQSEQAAGPKQVYRNFLASHGPIEFDDRLKEFPVLNVGDPTSPDRLLEPHLQVVLNIIPADRRSELGEVYAGIIPYKEPNARVHRAPNGGVLILVNQGLVTCLYSWAQALVDVASLAGSDRPDVAERLDRVYSAFQDSYESYRETQTVSPVRYVASPETKVVSSLITWTAVWFVLAHECAHVLRGEIGAALTGDSSSHGWGDEHLVDQLAMELFLPKPTDSQYAKAMRLRLPGTTYALGILIMLEKGLTDKAFDALFRNMDLAMQWAVESTRPGEDNYKITRLIRVGLVRLRNVVNQGYVRSAQLHPVELLKRTFWAAHAGRNTGAQRHLISDDPPGYRSWAAALRRKAAALDESKTLCNTHLGDNTFMVARVVTFPRWAYSEKFDSDRLRALARAVEVALDSLPCERLLATESRWARTEWESEDSEEIGMPTPILDALIGEDHTRQAIRFMKAGELQKALEQQNEAIRLNPERASFYHNRGLIMAMWDRCDEAVPDFEKAISINRTSIAAHTGLADCLLQIGRVSQGITMLDRAIELSKQSNPGDFAPELVAALHLVRCNALLVQNNDDGAMSDFTRAAQILSEPKVAEAFVKAEETGVTQLSAAMYRVLSMLLYAEKQYESCLVISERLLVLAAEDPSFTKVETKEIAQVVQHLKTLQSK